MHNTFHVSQLHKCVVDESVVVPLDDIQVNDLLNFMERLVVILDRKIKALGNKVVPLFKVQCQHQKRFEWTWDPEAEMPKHYPELVIDDDFEDEV